MTVRTNIVIDVSKLKAAKAVTHLKTTREVVDYALTRLTQSAEALSGLKRLKGKVEFSKNYDYKANR